MNQPEEHKSSQEPSVLDYLTSKIKFWERSTLSLAESELATDDSSLTTAVSKTKSVNAVEHKMLSEKKAKAAVTEEVIVPKYCWNPALAAVRFPVLHFICLRLWY